MEIPGIGEKMWTKIYQAVNRFLQKADRGRCRYGRAAASGDAPAEEGEAAKAGDGGDGRKFEAAKKR